MQLEMLVSLLVFSLVFRWGSTVTVCTVFSLLILSILDLSIILTVGLKELLRSRFNPFLIIFYVALLRSFNIGDLFLLHEVEVKTILDNNLNKEVFPVFKEDAELLFQIFSSILALFFFCRSKSNKHQFFGVMFQRFFEQFKQSKRRRRHFFVEVECQKRVEMVTKVEGMLDLVPYVSGTVITHKAIETVIDYILPSFLFLLNFLLSSLAPHHLRF